MAVLFRVLVALAVLLVHVPAMAQIPDSFTNLRHFPTDITRDALIQRMREFSFALSVRCQHCHAGGDGVSFAGVDFASDAKPAKAAARVMLRMLDSLNQTTLASVPNRRDPPVRLDCVHCHRGSTVPTTLASELTRVIDAEGVAAAVARYRALRDSMADGRFDFTEWSMNELARSLTERGSTEAAIAMLELNAEYYPRSVAIDMGLADLHRARGEREKAIARYRRALEKDPKNVRARRAIEELDPRKP